MMKERSRGGCERSDFGSDNVIERGVWDRIERFNIDIDNKGSWSILCSQLRCLYLGSSRPSVDHALSVLGRFFCAGDFGWRRNQLSKAGKNVKPAIMQVANPIDIT